jgi:hypothetical protein
MIRSTDSELAANLCRSFGTTGEVRMIRGLTCSGSLTWPVMPPSADTATFQTVSARTFHPTCTLGALTSQGEPTIQNP